MPNSISSFAFVKKSGDVMTGDLDLGPTGNLILADGRLVDGKDVSEMQKPSGRLYLASDQLNLSAGFPSRVDLDTIDPDFNDGIEDVENHKITPGVAGYYLITGQVTLDIEDTNAEFQVTVKMNAATNILGAHNHNSLAGRMSVRCSNVYYLDDNDYVQLYIKPVTGGDTTDVLGSKAYTFLGLQRVR